METIKPETRCECETVQQRFHQHPHKFQDPRGDHQCINDAVRLVTMRVDGLALTGMHYANVAMCAPCADWHKSKGA